MELFPKERDDERKDGGRERVRESERKRMKVRLPLDGPNNSTFVILILIVLKIPSKDTHT